ncbi:MAG: FAD:protein FMN transferase [Pseudomonadota bacterium]
MGTTYNVIAIAPAATSSDDLGKAIEASLTRVNKHLSNWDPTSEISRFNATRKTTPVAISEMMAQVMATANDVHRDSGGLFDVTLAPLIELWGFGTRKAETPLPAPEKIAAAQAKVGQLKLLKLDRGASTMVKRDVQVTINLSAIAKGFGVDEVAAVLNRFNVENYMVEIGGDLVTSGVNERGQKWRIGVEKPVASSRRVQLTVDISNLGMATSGDYRNYKEQAGVRYSHVLNPRTGQPIKHRTASVTVLAKNAMLADAWATALLVAGQDRGMEIAKTYNLAALFISKGNGKAGDQAAADGFVVLMSPKFMDIKGES